VESKDHKLFLGSSFDALWDGAAEHWFCNTCASSWLLEAVDVVLVPSRAHGFFIKSRLIEHGLGFAGVQFWTPGECRDALVARLKHRPIAGVREHLHLVLAAAAEQESTPVARSVARDPSSLMAALDALSAAGLPWTNLPYASLQPVIARFEKYLAALGWTTVQHIDRLLLANNKGKAIDRLLVIGFDGAHWPMWNLLQAAVAASEESNVCLTAPRYKSEQLDQTWISSWEQLYGEAELVDDNAAVRPFAALAERMENPEGGTRVDRHALIHFGHDLREQARAAAAQAIAYLAEDTCTRLGILVPGYSALSREIAAELARHGIVFNDTLGCNAAPPPDNEGWRAWVDLQAAPDLASLLDFARHTQDQLAVPFERTAEALTRAASEVLVHDLPVLAAYLKDARDEKDRAVGMWLSGFRFLPESGTLNEFVAMTRADRADALERAAGEMPKVLSDSISKSTFLAWLNSITNTPFRQRDPAATHPFARVHLLSYAQAEGQGWSHLIMTGLNEGVWPPRQEPAPFLTESAIDAINRDAVQQGAQGEGHTIVKPGRALLPGPAQRRALLQRQFYNLVESAAHGLCLTASVTDEADPSRRLLPSEYLTYLYFVQQSEPLSDEWTARLQSGTAEWLGQLVQPDEVTKVTATGHAFRARRDATKPFGHFEFALAQPPAAAPHISCKTWEDIVKAPAIRWLDIFCGVSCLDLDPADDGRALTRGTWVHRWLAHAGTPDGVHAAAEKDKARIAKAFLAARRSVPDRWTAGWRDAVWIAQRMGEQIQPFRAGNSAATEVVLPEALSFDTGAGKLLLRGRIDLLLSSAKDRCWIIDYKTGGTKPLSSRNLAGQLEKGNGIQLSLYVLAMRAQGMNEISASLLTPDQPAAPQITLADVLAFDGVWKELCRMQDTGIFGMREELRPEYSRGPTFPLATLAIEKEILEAKWALTHPPLSKAEEE